MYYSFHKKIRNSSPNIIIYSPTTWLPTFFKISYFVFSKRKKFKQVWNNLRVSKWQNNFCFWVNYSFKRFSTLIIRNVSWAGSIFSWYHMKKILFYIFITVKYRKNILNCIQFSQYCWFYCIFGADKCNKCYDLWVVKYFSSPILQVY